MSHDTEELIDYEDDQDGGNVSVSAARSVGDREKKNFSGIHSTGFR